MINDITSESTPATSTAEDTTGFFGLTSARLLSLASILDIYYTPVLCLFGILGNCLSVTVFCYNGSHKNLSSAFYLSALAISDTGFLLNLFAFWLDGMGIGILSTTFGCPFIMYSGQVTCFLSVWLTVGFTIERYFAVCSPLTRPLICTVSKAKKVTFGLSAVAIIAFSYVLIIARVLPKDEVFYYVNQKEETPNSDTDGDFLYHSVTTDLVDFSGKNPHEESSSTGETLNYGMFNHFGGSPNGTQKKIAKYERSRNLSPSTPSSWDMGKQYEEEQGDYVKRVWPPQRPQEEVTFLGTPLHVGTESRRYEFEGISSRTITDNNRTNYSAKLLFTEEKQSSPSSLICTVPQNYLTISIVANYIDSIITLIIPFCLIAYFNMQITRSVWKISEERKNIIALIKINGNSTSSSKSHKTDSISDIERSENNEDKSSHVGYVKPNIMDEQSKIMASRGSGESKRIKWKETNETTCNGIEKLYGIKDNFSVNRKSNCHGQSTELVVSYESDNKDPCGRNDNFSNPYSSSSSRTSDSHSLSSDHQEIQALPRSMTIKGVAQHFEDEKQGPNRLLTSNCSAGDNDGSVKSSVQQRSEDFCTKIITTTTKAKTRRKQQIQAKVLNKGTHNPNNIMHSSFETRVTKMLLLVSSAFIVLNLPSHAIRAAGFVQRILWEDDREGQMMLHAAQQLSNILLFNTNFAVNFLLYCFSGKNFRKSLKNVLIRTSQKNPLGRMSKNLSSMSMKQRKSSSEVGSTVEVTVVHETKLSECNEEFEQENFNDPKEFRWFDNKH